MCTISISCSLLGGGRETRRAVIALDPFASKEYWPVGGNLGDWAPQLILNVPEPTAGALLAGAGLLVYAIETARALHVVRRLQAQTGTEPAPAVLREKLVANGHAFTSDTDTEVIAHLGMALREALQQIESEARMKTDDLTGAVPDRGNAMKRAFYTGSIVITEITQSLKTGRVYILDPNKKFEPKAAPAPRKEFAVA